MAKLGNNCKITAPRSAQAGIRKLFDALSASAMSPNDSLDVFTLETTFVGVYYVADSEALTASQMRIAPWLEFVVDDPAAAIAKLDGAGTERVAYSDPKGHTYFAAPGGAVFRIAARA